MKAIRITGPGICRVLEIPTPEPGPGDVRVRIKAAGICGTDHELFTNDMVYLKQGRAHLPLTPGHEWSGIVDALGPGVRGFSVGDTVTGECTVSCGACAYCQMGLQNQCLSRTETGIMNRDGAFAEHIVFPVSHLHRFARLSFEEAALVEPTAIALHALMRGKVTPHDNVLVTGPGPVGLQVAQMAKRVFHARRVILTGTRQERLARAQPYGLDATIDVRREDLHARITETTDGEMIDVAVEESGGATALQDILSVLKPRGRIVLNGFFGSKNVAVDWDAITVREISLRGSLGSPRIWDEVIRLMEKGDIEARGLISHTLPLERFADGIDLMISRKENACKVIIQP